LECASPLALWKWRKRTATRLGQTDAGLLCHVAAPGDGRTPAAGGKPRRQNQFWDGRPVRMAFELLERNMQSRLLSHCHFQVGFDGFMFIYRKHIKAFAPLLFQLFY
jgi:hypothetical protein